MRSEPRTRVFQVLVGLVLTVSVLAVSVFTSGCNPLTLEVALSSPSGAWLAELISHDVSYLTKVEGERGFLVVVRKPEEKRNTDTQLVIHAFGRTAPSLKWASEDALDVHLPPSVEVMKQQRVDGVTVNVRRP
jgi:hypothetical protein